jgi:rare lipoprotein A
MISKLCITVSTVAALSSVAQPAFCAEDGFADQASSGMRRMFAGIASFYAEKFNGRRTASGARFDMTKMTCAHKSLPFGTQLVIKNVVNGKTCTVTVNDRGPFCKGRVLDLSKAAAHSIGITGTAHIEAYAAEKPKNAPAIVATLPVQPPAMEAAPAAVLATVSELVKEQTGESSAAVNSNTTVPVSIDSTNTECSHASMQDETELD